MTGPATGARLGVSLLVLALGFVGSGISQTENLNVTPTFRASSHLVLVDVVVTDKAGNPIRDLRREDFQIKEDGKQQQIAFFTAPSSDARGPVPPSLPPGIYSNAPAYRLASGTPTVIVLDAANTQYRDQVYARRQMLKYLKEQYKPGQRIAVFALTDRLSLLQDFTSDPELLVATLEKVVPRETSLPTVTTGAQPSAGTLRISTSQEYQALLAAFERFQKSEAQFVAGARAELTLDAMRRITRMLGGLPGRKNVIWLNGGFPFTLNPDLSVSSGGELGEFFQNSVYIGHSPGSHGGPFLQSTNYADAVREVAAQMATSQVAIYPIDARGLFVGGVFSTGDSQETMREIARQTGGKAFVNQNDIDNGVALAQRDSATYTIGYYPNNKKWDNKYRPLDLKVDRASVQTTYRRGYFAIDTTASASRTKLDQALSEAWQDGAPDTLVTFEAKVSPAERGKARVDFLVDANTLTAGEGSEGRKFDVSFYVAGVSKDGKIMPVQGTKLERAFAPDLYQRITREGMRLHLDANTPSEGDELLLAVRDNRTGYIGTIRARIPSKP